MKGGFTVENRTKNKLFKRHGGSIRQHLQNTHPAAAARTFQSRPERIASPHQLLFEAASVRYLPKQALRRQRVKALGGYTKVFVDHGHTVVQVGLPI